MISIYEQRTLDTVQRSMPTTGKFIRDTFFKRRKPILGKTVDIDFKKGGRSIAPFVNEKSTSKTVGKKGYKTNTFTTPLIKMKDITTIEDISSRVAGEKIYAGMTREERAIEDMTEVVLRFNEMIDRREEWMAAQALLTGKIPVIGEDVKYEIDFGFTNREVLTGEKLWSSKNSDKLADIERWITECKQKGYRTPNICIMSRDVVAEFLNDEKVQAILDSKNINLATIEPKMLDENVTYIGTIAKWNLSIYQYDEWYIDDWTNPNESEEKPLIPNGTVLLASSNADSIIYYGELTIASENAPSGFISYITNRVTHSWVTHDPDARFIGVDSRPLPAPLEVDSWYSATVL